MGFSCDYVCPYILYSCFSRSPPASGRSCSLYNSCCRRLSTENRLHRAEEGSECRIAVVSADNKNPHQCRLTIDRFGLWFVFRKNIFIRSLYDVTVWHITNVNVLRAPSYELLNTACMTSLYFLYLQCDAWSRDSSHFYCILPKRVSGVSMHWPCIGQGSRLRALASNMSRIPLGRY